jgi:hypothetical protein
MKRLLCLIGTHDFRQHEIEGGHGTYLECRHCGKVDDRFEPRGNAGAIWGYGIG